MGTGFRRTGEAVFIFEFWAWKEENEGMLMVVGFERAGIEFAEAVETEGVSISCADRPRSMARGGHELVQQDMLCVSHPVLANLIKTFGGEATGKGMLVWRRGSQDRRGIAMQEM